MWRNWYTRTTQNRVGTILCGFDSHHRHQVRQTLPDFIQRVTEIDKTNSFYLKMTPTRCHFGGADYYENCMI